LHLLQKRDPFFEEDLILALDIDNKFFATCALANLFVNPLRTMNFNSFKIFIKEIILIRWPQEKFDAKLYSHLEAIIFKK
jgi:hypothetical protein